MLDHRMATTDSLAALDDYLLELIGKLQAAENEVQAYRGDLLLLDFDEEVSDAAVISESIDLIDNIASALWDLVENVDWAHDRLDGCSETLSKLLDKLKANQ